MSTMNEWGVKKKWYTYTVKYYSAMRKEDIFLFAKTWMGPEHIMLSKIKQKDKYCDTYMWNLKKLTL